MVKDLNSNNFEEFVANGTALVDFYADWCGPCQMIKPFVHEIAEERTDIKVGKVNVDLNSSLAMRFNVASIPTLLVFKDGKLHGTMVGYRTKDGILASIDD